MSTPRELRERQQRLRATPSQASRRPRTRLPIMEGVGGIPVVVRSLDLDSDPQTMTVQMIQYTDSPPIPGNLEAVGSDITAYPFPGWSYEMYNVAGLLRRHADAADPEVFGTNVLVCLLLPDSTLLIPLKLIANMGATDPNTETT